MFRGVGIGGCQCLRGSAGGGQVREKKDAVNGYVFVDGDHTGEGVYADAMALESRMEPWGVIAFHDGNNPAVQQGLFRASKEWKRAHRLMHLACDTISQTPEGVFAGISMILVDEPNTVPTSARCCCVSSKSDKQKEGT
jgi:hypothetical protein